MNGQDEPSIPPDKDEPPPERELRGVSGLAKTARGSVIKLPGPIPVHGGPWILVMPDMRSMDISVCVHRIAGLIVEAGALLSHTGTIAREHGILALFSVRGAMKYLHDGDEIEVDGTSGHVRIINSSKQV